MATEKTTSVETTMPVPATPATPALVTELKSDKLTTLQSQRSALTASLKNPDNTDEKLNEIFAAIMAKDGEIKIEKHALQTSENERKLAEARSKRLAINQTQLDAYKALITAGAKTTPEAMSALQSAFDNARTDVENGLLGNLPKTSTGTGTTTGTSTKGATSQAILAAYDAARGAGQNDTDARKTVIAAGYSRGTSGAVILATYGEKAVNYPNRATA